MTGAVPTRRKWPCPFCRKRMKRLSDVGTHIRMAHGTAWFDRWIAEGGRDRLRLEHYGGCPVCGRPLQRRVRIHAKCRPSGTPAEPLRTWRRGVRYRAKTLREYGDDSRSPYVFLQESGLTPRGRLRVGLRGNPGGEALRASRAHQAKIAAERAAAEGKA